MEGGSSPRVTKRRSQPTRRKGAGPVPGTPTVSRADKDYCGSCYHNYSPVGIAYKEQRKAERIQEKAQRAAERQRDLNAAILANETYLAQRNRRLQRNQRRALVSA